MERFPALEVVEGDGAAGSGLGDGPQAAWMAMAEAAPPPPRRTILFPFTSTPLRRRFWV